MKYDYYLKRQKINLEDLINKKNITDYEQLFKYFKSLNIQPPAYEETEELFKEKIKHVEERPAKSSNNKKPRVSNKKNGESQADDSTSARRSTPKQQTSKSAPKRRRKRNSKKVEPIQPNDGSESSK